MEKEKFNLTNPQKSAWLTQQMYPDMPIENVCGTVFIDEKVDFIALEKAMNLFVEKNDSFRIKVTENGNKIQQYVSDFEPFKIDIENVKDEKEIKELETKVVSTPFSMLDKLLFKFAIFKLENGQGGFIVNAHHLISDAWTAGLVVNEIMDFYAELIKVKPQEEVEKPSYIDYINSEKEYINSERFKKDKEYWESLFNEVPELAKIPSMK